MFNSFSAEDCKKRWMFVMTHLKRHRSLSDILNDCFAWSKMKVDKASKVEKTSEVKGPKKTKKKVSAIDFIEEKCNNNFKNYLMFFRFLMTLLFLWNQKPLSSCFVQNIRMKLRNKILLLSRKLLLKIRCWWCTRIWMTRRKLLMWKELERIKKNITRKSRTSCNNRPFCYWK